MSDITELIKEVKIPGLSRELMYFFSGFLIILILNFLFKTNIKYFQNIFNSNTYPSIVALITISYFASRLCKEIGHFIVTFTIFILKTDKLNFIRDQFKRMDDFINSKAHLIGNSRDVSQSELNLFITENKGINFLFERSVQYEIITEIFTGFTFILGIIFSFYFYLVTIFLVISALTNQLNIWENRVDIAEHLYEKRRNINKS